MFKRILIVCIGNICRSPTAEHLLRSAILKAQPDSDIQVSSAGLGALVDRGLESTAQEILQERGNPPMTHKARQLDRALVTASDLILVMEKGHIDGVLRISPEARGKVYLLGKWQGDLEIDDPYKQGKPAFVHAYTLIDKAINAWAQRIAR